MRPLLTAALLLLTACGGGSEYTLYRSSALDANARIYVATFGNGESDAYNQENCRVAQDLFNAQKGIVTRFWCEKGDFKK